MKHFIFILIGALVFFSLFLRPSEIKAGNGSFLITKSAYLRANPYNKEDKILTRKRMAYEVVGVISLNRSLMFEILAALDGRVVAGGGYIVETDDDLRSLTEKNIKEANVYMTIPQNTKDLSDFIKIPVEKLSPTGMTKDSSAFPEITWRAVNYKAVLLRKYWVPEWAGIYRPDKEAEWLNRTYKELLRSSYKKSVKDKIIKGLVEVGFTEKQVVLALGSPLRETTTQSADLIDKDEPKSGEEKKQPSEKRGESEQLSKKQSGEHESQWIYKTQKIIFQRGRVSRVL